MKVLALDQSLKVTGWSLYENDKLLTYGHFEIPGNKPLEDRLQMFWQHLEDLYAKYDFTQLAYEDIQKQANVETFKKLAYVQAAVLLWCSFRDVRAKVFAPTVWRHLLKEKYGCNFGQKRADQKAAAKKFVQEKHTISPTEDEADAICIGLAAWVDAGKTESAF